MKDLKNEDLLAVCCYDWSTKWSLKKRKKYQHFLVERSCISDCYLSDKVFSGQFLRFNIVSVFGPTKKVD